MAEISLAPSLHTLRLLYERRNDIRAGDQSPALSLLDETLPGHHDEAAALDEWPFGHHRIVGLDDLPEASLLYISGIADSPGAEASLGTGNLTLDQLVSAHLPHLPHLPRLVILNGCWSGTATSRYGTEPFTLAVGALLGSADTVLAGAGEIGSSASALVAAHVLALLQTGYTTPQALRRSQRTIRDGHPELAPTNGLA